MRKTLIVVWIVVFVLLGGATVHFLEQDKLITWGILSFLIPALGFAMSAFLNHFNKNPQATWQYVPVGIAVLVCLVGTWWTVDKLPPNPRGLAVFGYFMECAVAMAIADHYFLKQKEE
jgi:peptidoglycan/LPS O-acetylase OafA/YrhL